MDRTLQEIEQAVDALTPQQREEFSSWFERQHPQAIDQVLQDDLKSGLMDELIAGALADDDSGETSAL